MLKDPDALPKVEVFTEKLWARHTTKFEASPHYYEKQAQEFWEGEVLNSQRTLGQRLGGKYTPRLKQAVAYLQAEMDEHVASHRKRMKASALAPSGLASLIGDGDASMAASGDDSSGESGDEDGESGEEGDKDDECSADDAMTGGLLALANAPHTHAAASSAVGQSRGRMTGPSAAAEPSSSQCARATPQKVGKMRSPAKLMQAQPSPSSSTKLQASSASVGGLADADETNCRAMPPGYWMRTLTPEAAVSDVNLTKQLRWTEACVKRTSQTNSVEAMRLSPFRGIGGQLMRDAMVSQWLNE